MKTQNKCRLCKGKLRYAMKIKKLDFSFCEDCTLLQRTHEIPYEINFNFEGRYFELPYFPVFLKEKNLTYVTNDSAMFFTLKSVTFLLRASGYTIQTAQIVGDKLIVSFDKATPIEKVKAFEEIKRLDNKYTYFLYSIQQDKDE